MSENRSPSVDCRRCGAESVEKPHKGSPALWCPDCDRLLFRSTDTG